MKCVRLKFPVFGAEGLLTRRASSMAIYALTTMMTMRPMPERIYRCTVNEFFDSDGEHVHIGEDRVLARRSKDSTLVGVLLVRIEGTNWISLEPLGNSKVAVVLASGANRRSSQSKENGV